MNPKNPTDSQNPQQPTRIQNNPHQPKVKKSFSKWLFILVGIIIICSVTATSLLLLQSSDYNRAQQPQPTPQPPTPRANPTSDWHTYRNEEYGFEFKYPDTLTLSDPHIETNGALELNLMSTNDDANTSMGNCLMNPELMVIIVNNFSFKENGKNYFDQLVEFEREYNSYNNVKISESSIGGKEARIFTYSGPSENIRLSCGLKKGEILRVIIVENNRIDYEFQLIYSSENSKIHDIFNQILATVNFTDVPCTPRPSCLDTEPKCLITETSDMCPPSLTPENQN